MVLLKRKEEVNFIECETKEEANRVDLTKYSFIGLKHNSIYSFKKRAKVSK